MNSVTIDQCVEKINTRLAEEGLAAAMNVRLLRHYQQNKSIPAPTQEGRFAKYNDEHVEAVVALRKAQDMGVSSKAYTTISNIEKHVNQHATVASLGLDTPSWLANSAVGSVSSFSATPQALNLFGTSLDNAHAFSNIKIERAQAEPSLKTSSAIESPKVLSANTMFGTPRSELAPLSTACLPPKGAAAETVPLETPRSAALRVLESLDATLQTHRKSTSNARTMSTLARMVTTPNIPSSLALAVNAFTLQKQASYEITKWTLANDVCVQIPSSTLNSLSSENRKAFEAWMAQSPNLT